LNTNGFRCILKSLDCLIWIPQNLFIFYKSIDSIPQDFFIIKESFKISENLNPIHPLKIRVYAIIILLPPFTISFSLSLLSSSYSFSSSSQFWKSKPSKIVLRTTTQMQLKSTTILLALCESAYNNLSYTTGWCYKNSGRGNAVESPKHGVLMEENCWLIGDFEVEICWENGQISVIRVVEEQWDFGREEENRFYSIFGCFNASAVWEFFNRFCSSFSLVERRNCIELLS